MQLYFHQFNYNMWKEFTYPDDTVMARSQNMCFPKCFESFSEKQPVLFHQIDEANRLI